MTFKIRWANHGFVIAAMVASLGAWLWGQAAADESIAHLVREHRYKEAANRIESGKAAHRASEGWETYAEHCAAQAERAYDRGEYASAIGILDSALSALKGTAGANSAAAAYLWSWKAIAHRQLEQYTEVLEAYEVALKIYESLKEHGPHVAYCYKNAAQVFIRRQDYRSADQYLKAALLSDPSGYYQLSIYAQLTNSAYWQDSLDTALRYISFADSLDGPPEARASLLSASAQVYRRRGKWKEARRRLEQALAYYNTQPDEIENRIRCLSGLADVMAHMGQPTQAEAYFKQAEQLGLRVYKYRGSREMAKLYCEWGDWAMQYQGVKEALCFYQKALKQVFSQLDAWEAGVNLSPEAVPIELWAMNAAARNAEALLHVPNIENRKKAAFYFDVALAVAERLRSTYGTDEAKLYFSAHNFDLLREAVRNEWALLQHTNEERHQARLFDLVERGRANALRDALHQQRALALAQVPDSLLRREEMLRRERAATQSAQLRAESQGDTLAAQRCAAALFRLERQYAEILRLLRSYPQFREYSRADQRISLSSLRQTLPDSAVLLLFFDAADSYLCLAISRQHFWTWAVSRDLATDTSIAYLCQILPQKHRMETEMSRFLSTAFEVRRRLIPDSLLAICRSLIIVPDGQLTYLPFEVLLVQPHTETYSAAPYLLRTFAIRYVWSASFLAAEKNSSPRRRARLLQVAPFLAEGRRGMSPLPYCEEEQPSGIAADALIDAQATADNFLKTTDDYDVFHLSTHARAGAPQETGIEFYDRTLALPEIYAQRLRAALVTLSACQTNTGAFAQGEGVLSLARAFAYAGARSLVASYWSVNDRSTAQLFAAFYQHLKQGLPRSEALRQAKLHLLGRPAPEAHKSPYYWAAFTLMGEDGPIEFIPSSADHLWMLAILLVMSGFAVLWLEVRRRKARIYQPLRA
ncbi:MAG: CHAT domain-containing protein [Saprospiraceae bacterium]|nr:CHAT domain-containing protein [Saprospiraceae bacterium]MDW8483977.1 CHAT domain-containing tetratricopeptide repeat protein [Saprospiraceae bacterium]